MFVIVAGLGLQELVGREIAKDPRRADDLVWNAIAVRALTLVAPEELRALRALEKAVGIQLQ